MVFDHKTCKFPVFRRFRFQPQPASAIFLPQKKAFLIRKLKWQEQKWGNLGKSVKSTKSRFRPILNAWWQFLTENFCHPKVIFSTSIG